MSEHRPRVVFDCMIFLQAAARRASQLAALTEQGLLDLYISPAILAGRGPGAVWQQSLRANNKRFRLAARSNERNRGTAQS